MNKGEEATLVEGEAAPPTGQPRWNWKLVDRTKHAGDESEPELRPTGEANKGGAPARAYRSASRIQRAEENGD